MMSVNSSHVRSVRAEAKGSDDINAEKTNAQQISRLTIPIIPKAVNPFR